MGKVTELGRHFGSGYPVIYVDTIADLQALPVGELVDKQQAEVKGDPYLWDFSTTQWVPVIRVNVKSYGAAGDGVTDDSTAIQAAVDDAPDGGVVWFPAGTYVIGSEIYTNKSINILGEGSLNTILRKPAIGRTFRVDSESTTKYLSFSARNIQFLSNVSTLGFSEQHHQLHISGIDGGEIEYCKFVGFYGDGIYLGSSNVAGVERHNKNVRITNSFFDGVNNDNRNAISVIDGEDVKIDANHFTRCTRSNMPGAIDIEPNNNTFVIIRNITVSNNTIINCGGNVGNIAFIRPGTNPDSRFKNIYFVNNRITSSTNSGVYISAGIGAKLLRNVNISGNTLIGVYRPIIIANSAIQYLNIKDNMCSGSGVGLIGVVGDIEGLYLKISMTGNTFTSSANSCLQFNRDYRDVTISSNIFKCDTSGARLIRFGGDYYENISVTGNSFTGTLAEAPIDDTCAGSSPENCTFLGNVTNLTSNFFKAFRTDFPHAFNDNTAYSFNSATLPSSFSFGESRAVINGDTGVPSVGGTQGVLVTYKYQNISKFIYQTYYSANNTSAGTFFVRKGGTTTDTWSAWYRHDGTVV